MVKKIKLNFIKKVKNIFSRVNKRTKAFLKRRPHRSFRFSRRRDYARSLKLPGYLKFNKYVFSVLWLNRKLFVLLAVTSAALTASMVGITSQNSYSSLKNVLDSTGIDMLGGNWGQLGKASLLFLSTITGGLSDTLTESQQIYSVIIVLLTWLTTVWLLRNVTANRKVRLRDGLYNACSPILSTFIIFSLLIIQLLPAALAIAALGAASLTGLTSGGVEAMLFWIAFGLLIVLSVYLISSTFFALIIVTLPGMYPSVALRTAGDLVVGRRLRILGRIAFLAVEIFVIIALIIIPIILLDSWLKGLWKSIDWLPTVPIAVLLLSSMAVVWSASYIYLLYRKVVEDGADPA